MADGWQVVFRNLYTGFLLRDFAGKIVPGIHLLFSVTSMFRSPSDLIKKTLKELPVFAIFLLAGFFPNRKLEDILSSLIGRKPDCCSSESEYRRKSAAQSRSEVLQLPNSRRLGTWPGMRLCEKESQKKQTRQS